MDVALLALVRKGEPEVAFQQLTLLVVDGMFAVCRLGGDAPIPLWATARRFFSITRTADELSVDCRQDDVPEGIQCERSGAVCGWLGSSRSSSSPRWTAPLAEAGISVFAVSTFDTDYLLVKEADFEKALAALPQAGHSITK